MAQLLFAPQTLASGAAINIEIWRGIRLTVIPGSGSTVTISKIDNLGVAAHDSATSESTGVELTRTIDWPFYRVSSSGGTARVAAY